MSDVLKKQDGRRLTLQNGAPLWLLSPSKTMLLLHMNGDNDSTTIVDSSASAHAMTATGSAKLKTAEKKFGSASLNVLGPNNTGKVTTPKGSDFYFGTGDFTVEMFVNWTEWRHYDGEYNNPCLISCGPSESDLTNAGWCITVMYGALSGIFINQQYGTSRTVTAQLTAPPWTIWTPTLGQWYHIAFLRSSGVLRLYIDGTQWGGNVAATENQTTSTKDLHIGVDPNAAGSWNTFNGYLDEIRVSKGLAVNPATFPPTGEYS